MWRPCVPRIGEAGRPYALQALVRYGLLSLACCCVQDATNVGDEGGFAPSINSTTEGLDLIVAAISARPASYYPCAHHRVETPSLDL